MKNLKNLTKIFEGLDIPFEEVETKEGFWLTIRCGLEAFIQPTGWDWKYGEAAYTVSLYNKKGEVLASRQYLPSEIHEEVIGNYYGWHLM